MTFDPSNFYKLNVSDTCALWNLLSSNLLYSSAKGAGCYFCCTSFVYYECIQKPRKNLTQKDKELRNRFIKENEEGRLMNYSLDIQDLQEVRILESRKKLGKGELASIAFARKTNQAFLTDDQSARKLAIQVMDADKVQTTPHLFGWLIYFRHVRDEDKDTVLNEHEGYVGKSSLRKYFEVAFSEGVRCREMSTSAG